jgi:hypothetical protein
MWVVRAEPRSQAGDCKRGALLDEAAAGFELSKRGLDALDPVGLAGHPALLFGFLCHDAVFLLRRQWADCDGESELADWLGSLLVVRGQAQAGRRASGIARWCAERGFPPPARLGTGSISRTT